MVVVRADGSAGSYMDRVSRQEVEEANTPVARRDESSARAQHHSSAAKTGMAAAQNSRLLSSRPGFQAGGNRTTFRVRYNPDRRKRFDVRILRGLDCHWAQSDES